MTHAPIQPIRDDQQQLGLRCMPERVRDWNGQRAPAVDGTVVVYLMMRAQRGQDNLALDAAIDAANHLDLPVMVLVRVAGGPKANNLRHASHMIRAIPELADDVQNRGAVFVTAGTGDSRTSDIVNAVQPALVVLDEDAMPEARASRARIGSRVKAPVISVDADVVVPQGYFYQQEYAARTIRPKIHAILEACLADSARDVRCRVSGGDHVHDIASKLPADAHVTAAGYRPPATAVATFMQQSQDRFGAAGPAPLNEPSGHRAGMASFSAFIDNSLTEYHEARNKPEVDGTSRASIALHFGHVSPITLTRMAQDHRHLSPEGADSLIEEMVVRRELAVNYVRWNPTPDSLEGAADWARLTLSNHAGDPRPALYDIDDLTSADTIDPLWNAAQVQMMQTGHMHGYMRMYWAKKILEWSDSPAEAFNNALTLNDRWSLDGRDPNGITGVAWAIAGVHDRAWPERAVFGKIRCMTLASTGRKFNSREYIARWHGDESVTVGPPS